MIKRLIAALLVLTIAQPALAVGRFEEVRFCGTPSRNADGAIVRSAAALAAFKKIYPCPATGKSIGACPGWAIDHVIPLACGGCDFVSNFQWLPNELKSKAVIGKDRFERRIYETSIRCNTSAK